MVTHRKLWLPAVFVVLLPNAVWAQQASSARDAFWSAVDLTSVTPNPAARNRTRARTSSSNAQQNIAVATPPASRGNQVTQLVAENGYGAAPHLVQTAEDRLGLRCSVLLRGADKEYTEVAPGAVFHSGDHIKLSFLANAPGYFYVIQQGSSGAWSPIYPPPHAAPDATKVEAGKLQVVPGGAKSFYFDQNPGDEKLYVILSRTPIEDIDRAIRNLENGQPGAATQPESSGADLEATNVIPDAFVRQLASRDLVLVDEEKVDDTSKHADSGEKAIYVVAKANSPEDSAQVVLGLDLRHE